MTTISVSLYLRDHEPVPRALVARQSTVLIVFSVPDTDSGSGKTEPDRGKRFAQCHQ